MNGKQQKPGKSEGLLTQPHQFRGTFAKKMIKSSMKKTVRESECPDVGSRVLWLATGNYQIYFPTARAESRRYSSLSQTTQLNPLAEKAE